VLKTRSSTDPNACYEKRVLGQGVHFVLDVEDDVGDSTLERDERAIPVPALAQAGRELLAARSVKFGANA